VTAIDPRTVAPAHPGAVLPGRRCDGCGAAMPSRMARTRREDGSLVCPSCARNPNQPAWAQARVANLEGTMPRRLAHDTSMVDAVARHCPFCGSGQTLGNSDGTISCGYCEQTYLVRLAPQFPAMPQVDPSTGAPVGAGAPLDASGQPVPPGSPSGAPSAPQGPPSGPPAGPPVDPTQQEMALAAHYRTRDGVLVGEDSFIEQLALRHAQDPAAVLAHATALRMLDTGEAGREAVGMSHTAGRSYFHATTRNLDGQTHILAPSSSGARMTFNNEDSDPDRVYFSSSPESAHAWGRNIAGARGRYRVYEVQPRSVDDEEDWEGDGSLLSSSEPARIVRRVHPA
jgi:uncharacterized Zn finger protein (UPF0148 family)